MKLAIVGAAGSIGSPSAFYIAQRNIVDKIIMIDPNQKLLKNHAMDMTQAVLEVSDSEISIGDYKDLGGADIIVLSAAQPAAAVTSRNAWLKGNLELLRDVTGEIKKYARDKVMVVVTNPVDICTYYVYKQLGWSRDKIIGFNVNDSVRVRWALHKTTGLEYKKLDGLCIGEHGACQVPLFSQVTYAGQPLELTEEVRAATRKAVRDWTTEFLELADARTTGWLCCITLSDVIADLVNGSKKPIVSTTPLEGEYRERDICLGVPVMLGPTGIREIVDLPISAEERAQFHEAADNVRRVIRAAGLQ
jgi:malate dehydrogenase